MKSRKNDEKKTLNLLPNQNQPFRGWFVLLVYFHFEAADAEL